MAAVDGGCAPKFSFQPLSGKKFPSLTEGCRAVHESLVKWSMNGRLQAQAFCYDQYFQAYQADEFVLDFFKDPNVANSLQIVSSSGKASKLGICAESVTVDPVPCSSMSMAYFDRLFDGTIVRSAETGVIVKCFEEYSDDFIVSDELRKMLLLEDSDHYLLFSAVERSEFLFRLFEHLCLGGSVCQYEDTVQPYLDVTKAVYKDLVSVQKNKDGELSITSLVFKVTASDKDGLFYPADTHHPQNFAYLIVDPIKRHVNVLHHKYGAAVLA